MTTKNDIWLPEHRGRHHSATTFFATTLRVVGWIAGLIVLALLVAWLWGDGII